jgi:hypothetical protein
MQERASVASAASLGVVLALAVLVCIILLDGVALQTTGIAAVCGVAGSIIWFAFPRLSPGVVGFLVSFLPAVFMPEAFFIGLGVLFIVVCSVAGGLFSAVGMLARRASK